MNTVSDAMPMREQRVAIAFTTERPTTRIWTNETVAKVAQERARRSDAPAEKAASLRPRTEAILENWIKRDAFAIDPQNPDPGRVPVPAG